MSSTQRLPAWWTHVEQHSATAGVSADVLRRIAGRESEFRNVDNMSGPGGRPTSSATGPFQIIEGTWNRLASQHPQLGLTNRRDPIQQAIAAPYLLRSMNAHIRHRVGRDPTPGEQRMAWFLGEGDAAKVINAAPGTDIRRVVSPASIQANASVFASIQTVDDMLAWGDRHMGESTLSPRTGTQAYGAGPQFSRGETLDPSITTPRSSVTERQREAAERARERDAYGIGEGALQALWAENGVNWAFKRWGASEPDPNYVFDRRQLDEVMPNAPREYIPYLGAAHSEADLRWRARQLQSDMEMERRLAAMGITGFGLRMLGALADPVGWAAAAAAAPVGGAMKVGRLGSIAAGAATGLGVNMVAEIPQAINKPTWTRDHLLYSAAAGIALGGALGGLMHRRTDIAPEIQNLGNAVRRAAHDLEPAGSSAGAMATPNRVAPVRGDTDPFMTRNFAEAQQRTPFGHLRFDVTSLLKNSENPLVRAAGNRLGLDAVGNLDRSTPTMRALTEERRVIEGRADLAFKQAYASAFDDYRSRLAGRGLTRTEDMLVFNREITRATRSRDPLVDVDPAVSRMADQMKRIMADYLELAQGNHLRIDGSMRRPMPGFEGIDKNDFYLPRYVDHNAFAAKLSELGDKGMSRLVTRALLARNPDIDARVAVKIGNGYVKRLKNVAAGQEDAASRVFSTLDLEDMRGGLRDLGLLDNEIEHALRRQVAKDAVKAGTPRGKPRVPFDENFSLEINGTRHSIMDIFHDDAMYIFQRYNKEMAGRIAMSRFRVENPNWRPGEDDIHPRFLVDGIMTDSDWEILLKQVKAIAADMGRGITDPKKLDAFNKRTQREVDGMDFLYSVITGRPLPGDTGSWAQWSRILRDINFSRVMGQVGFAQIPDIGQHFGSLGWKIALKSMPSLKQLMRDVRTGRIKDEDMAHLTELLGMGADWTRGKGRRPVDDYGNPIGRANEGRWVNRLEHFLHGAGRVTGIASGMVGIMTFIQRWAAQGALMKFADAANNGAALRQQRMRILGIDESMQEAILREIRDGQARTGLATKRGSLIASLDLDNWSPATRTAFEHAIFRWTRRVAQEGDPGQVNALLSGPTAKLITQFRTFGINSWTSNTLHNIHMRDWEAMSTILVSSFLAGLTWIAQSHLRSIGREDREDYLEEKLGNDRIAAAAIGRIGFASVLPGFVDTALDFAGFQPFFNNRSTGLSNGNWGSIPTGDAFQRLYGTGKALSGSLFHGETFTQGDFRTAFGLLLFQNVLPMQWFGNYLAAELPRR